MNYNLSHFDRSYRSLLFLNNISISIKLIVTLHRLLKNKTYTYICYYYCYYYGLIIQYEWCINTPLQIGSINLTRTPLVDTRIRHIIISRSKL